MSSALSVETDRDVLPWLQLAEDLRLLNLDTEVKTFHVQKLKNIFTTILIPFIAKYASNLCHGRSILW
jgi:hypothetical protein